MKEVIDISEDLGPTPVQKWLDVKLLRIDGNYQRDVMPSTVKYILTNFNWMYFQPPTVCPSLKKFYWVIDGQQRTRAAKLHPSISKIPCYIIDVPSTKEQAKAFIIINKKRRNVNPISLYWAGLTAQDPKYLVVERILQKSGAEVASTLGAVGPKVTNSVGSILRIIGSHGEENAEAAIRVLCNAYPKTKNVLRGNIIIAIATMFRDERDIDEDCLVNMLRSVDLDELNFSALKTCRLIGGSTPYILAAEIQSRYNVICLQEIDQKANHYH